MYIFVYTPKDPVGASEQVVPGKVARIFGGRAGASLLCFFLAF